jgi:hypothetical protein
VIKRVLQRVWQMVCKSSSYKTPATCCWPARSQDTSYGLNLLLTWRLIRGVMACACVSAQEAA